MLLRATNRQGDALNFRFYERRPIDTVGIAIQTDLLGPDNVLAPLITSWNSLHDGKPEQSCDFDAQKGLTKVWVYMGGFRPLDNILRARDVPKPISRHSPIFHNLRLESIRHVAVDYHSDTVNLYFRAPGPVTEEQAANSSSWLAALLQVATNSTNQCISLSNRLPTLRNDDRTYLCH